MYLPAFVLLLGAGAASDTAHVVCSAPPMILSVASNPISTILAGIIRVKDVKMQGQVIRYDGQKAANGAITFEVSSSGATNVSLDIGGITTGEQTDAVGQKRSCTWTAGDGTKTPFSKSNCLQPAPWFFPHVNLISQVPISGLAISDLGVCTDSSATIHRLHQSINVVSPKSDPKTLALLQTLTGSDLDVDPSTLLPVKLTYLSEAASPSHAVFTNEVRYSSYQRVSGIQVPYHIQKYLNGVLALDITITSVSIQ